jgi:hypothetical protein
MHHVNDPWANATILGKQVWACIGPKAEKRIPLNLGSQFATLGGQTTRAKNAQSWPQVCFGPHS